MALGGTCWNDNVLLNYDVYNQLVLTTVIRNSLSESILLDNARIDQFRIKGRLYVTVKKHASLSDGIYQLLYDKPQAKLYLSIKKVLVGNTGRPGEPLRKFLKQETFYLVLDNQKSYTVKKKKDLLKIFEHRPEIQKYIRTSRLRFKNSNQITISLLKVLDQL